MSLPLSADAALGLIKDAGGNLWKRQRDIVRAVFGSDRRATTVQSCTSSGKTHVAAWIIFAWMLTGSMRRVVTTAPSNRQVNSAVWSELRQIIAMAKARGMKAGGTIPPRAAEWFIEEGWNAWGFHAVNDANYAGIHSKGGTLVVVDDAQGLEDSSLETLKATLTDENDRLLMLANPVRRKGFFFDHCKNPNLEPTVNRLRISAFDTPNIRLGYRAIPGLVSQKQVDDIRALGETSALWITRVLGNFVDDDARALVPLDWLEASVQEWKELHPRTRQEVIFPDYISMGADVARLGADYGFTSVVKDWLFRDLKTGVPFRARIFEELERHPKTETMATVGLLKNKVRDVQPHSFRLDADGLGAGIMDRLREQNISVVEMRGGMRANDPRRYYNARAEWLFTFREMLRPKNKLDLGERPHLCIPPDINLQHQLSTTFFDLMSDGKVKVEPKELWSARNAGKSPDEMDATVMAAVDEPLDASDGAGDYLRAYG